MGAGERYARYGEWLAWPAYLPWNPLLGATS